MGNSNNVKKSQKGESHVTSSKIKKNCLDTMAANENVDSSDFSNIDLSDYLDIRTTDVLQQPVALKERKSAMPFVSSEKYPCLECALTTSRTFKRTQVPLPAEEDFCLVCGKFVIRSQSPHESSTDHLNIREYLLKSIYPHSCGKCPQKFLCEHDFAKHFTAHKIQAGQSLCYLDRSRFDPICCFLCLLPFENRRHLEVHEQSEEHNQKKRIAMEISQREVLAAKHPTFNQPLSIRFSKTTQTENQESPVKTDQSTASLKENPDLNTYFCCPCSVRVPKANVIEHETGKRHKKSCEIWVSNSPQKFVECPKPEELKNCAAMTSSELESFMTEGAMDRYILLEKKYISLKTTGSINTYNCSLCFTAGESHSSMSIFNHVISWPHRLHSDWLIEQTPSLKKEKVEILKFLKAVEDKESEVLRGINFSNVSKMIEIFDAEEKKSGELTSEQFFKDCQQSPSFLNPAVDLTSDTKNILSVNMIESSLEIHNGNTAVKNSMETGEMEMDTFEVVITPQKSPSLSLNEKQKHSTVEVPNKEYCSTPNDPYELNSVPNENGTSIYVKGNVITHQDIIEAVTEYFIIDGIVEVKKKTTTTGMNSQFKCSKCPLSCISIMQNMIPHMISKGHRTIVQHQTLKDLRKKLEILAFLQLARDSHKFLKSMDFVMVEKTLVEIRNLIAAGNLAVDRLLSTESNITTHPTISQPQYFSAGIESSQELEEPELGERVELRDPIVIGNSNSVSLQEQVELAFQGNEIEDFEMECGICGVVFQIFNDDVDFSFDMHIQDDPQHQLATAVPVERDAQNMAEMSKTLPTPMARPMVNRTPKYVKGRSTVIEELLQLEKKFITIKADIFFCQLCSVSKKKSLAAHHLLSKQHMSDNWASKFTDSELRQRRNILFSLQKCTYAVTLLTSAIGRIDATLRLRFSNEIQKNKPGLSDKEGEGSVDITECKLQSKDIFCEVCFLNISDFEKASRRKHRNQCYKIKKLENKTSSMSLSQPSKLNNTNTAPPKNWFVCSICKKGMSYNCRSSHLSGRLHKSKLAEMNGEVN